MGTGQWSVTLRCMPKPVTVTIIDAPLADKLTAPLARAFIRRTNETAMRRLAERLSTTA